MNEENPCETTPKHGVSGQADRTAHPPKSPTISTPDAGKTDRTEGEPSEKVGNGLLPCPFCGTVEMLRIVGAIDGHGWNFVRCDYCDAEGPDPDNFPGGWNRRAGGSHD